MEHHFSIIDSIRFGWEKTRAHSGLIFKMILTLFALQVVNAIVQAAIGNTLLGVLALIALAIVGVVVGVGMTRIILKLARGHKATYKEIIPPNELTIRYVLASLLAGLVVIGGLILLIIPGIYFALRYSMVRFAIIDGAGVSESLRKSAVMTHGVKWHLLGFFIVVGLLNLLGAILFLVGLLLTVPITLLAYAHIYQALHTRKGSVE